jgi:hypothetical protein
MGLTNFPNGLSSFGVPVLPSKGSVVTGSVFFVDSNIGANGHTGKMPSKPFATLDYAIGKCTASKGDIIYVMPGHAETLATASAITADVAGIMIIGLGVGASKPTFTFSATDATMVISAASVKFHGCIVTPSVDSVVSPIVVSGADCDIEYEHQDASASIECVSSFLTTATAERLKLSLRYRGFLAGNACVAPIRLVGVDTARIYVDFYGVASTSIVEFHTTACHDIVINGKFYNNGTTLTKNIVDTVTQSTWHASGWDGNSNSNFSGGDNAALAADDSSAIAAAVAVIDEFHDVPAANNTLNAQINEVIGNKTDATADGAVTTTDTLVGYIKQLVTDAIDKATRISAVAIKSTGDLTAFGTTKNLFTVTGDVLVKVGASVDVAVTSTSGTTTLEVGVAGNTACLCVQDAVDNSAFAIGDSWSLDTAADTNGALLSSEYILVGNGATIILTGSVDDITAGDIDFYCQYIPLSTDGAVVAAA